MNQPGAAAAAAAAAAVAVVMATCDANQSKLAVDVT